jgi:hypothetical protein
MYWVSIALLFLIGKSLTQNQIYEVEKNFFQSSSEFFSQPHKFDFRKIIPSHRTIIHYLDLTESNNNSQ